MKAELAPAMSVVAPAAGGLALTQDGLSAERPRGGAFMGSPGLSAEAQGVYSFTESTAYLRTCATLRLGAFNICGGVHVGDKTSYVLHLDLVSFQSHGWEVALGGGLPDGITLRVAIPLLRVARLSMLGGYGEFGAAAGAGLEVHVW